jgi:RNA polymerase sigma factor (TIGR02999 family)
LISPNYLVFTPTFGLYCSIEKNQKPNIPVGSAFEQAYEDLIILARAHFQSQPDSHTLQPTALVNEAFMKISNSRTDSPENHEHLLAIASQAMRHVLVDHARKKQSLKRGGDAGIRLTLTNIDSGNTQWDILELNDALDRLKELEPRQAEIVELRFFGGLTVDQVAQVLNVSNRTVYLDWQMSKAWLWADLRQGKE